jgi:hypothetical protein
VRTVLSPSTYCVLYVIQDACGTFAPFLLTLLEGRLDEKGDDEFDCEI